MPSLREWLDQQCERESLLWIKRLSASDTLAMGEGNPGPNIPIDVILEILPEVEGLPEKRHSVPLLVSVDNGDDESEVTANLSLATWARREDGSRVLVLDWGGAANTLLDPENTGSVAVLAFQASANGNPPTCDVWVCTNLDQEGIIESDWGPIDPGLEICWSNSGGETRLYSH